MAGPEPHTSSEFLVQRARARDPEAIGQLYERYRDRLRAALRRRLGDAYRRSLLDTEDALHDAILGALGEIESFEYRGSGSFLAWLLRIAELRIRERVRAQKAKKRDRDRQVPLPDEDVIESPRASPSQIAQGNETEARLQQCLEQLGERERDVIMLRRYLDLSHDEIRDELGLPSAGAARALLSRAQARLAVLLDREPPR